MKLIKVEILWNDRNFFFVIALKSITSININFFIIININILLIYVYLTNLINFTINNYIII